MDMVLVCFLVSFKIESFLMKTVDFLGLNFNKRVNDLLIITISGQRIDCAGNLKNRFQRISISITFLIKKLRVNYLK